MEWTYFESGEPFLYSPVLVRGIEEAARTGFKVGIVTNGYRSTTVEITIRWLGPAGGKVANLSVNWALFHWDEKISRQGRNTCFVAQELKISVGVITIVGLDENGDEPVT